MSHIIKNGKPVGIGRNVKVTLIPSELKEKRKALFSETNLIRVIDDLDSRRFYGAAKRDPVTFTYALWKLFKEDSESITDKLCDLAIYGDAKHVLRSLELMFFDASKKINAFCLNYIISQINGYIDHNPYKVKRAVKKVIISDFLTALKVMKGMYVESPRVTKEIGKKLLDESRIRVIRRFIKPLKRART